MEIKWHGDLLTSVFYLRICQLHKNMTLKKLRIIMDNKTNPLLIKNVCNLEYKLRIKIFIKFLNALLLFRAWMLLCYVKGY